MFFSSESYRFFTPPPRPVSSRDDKSSFQLRHCQEHLSKAYCDLIAPQTQHFCNNLTFLLVELSPFQFTNCKNDLREGSAAVAAQRGPGAPPYKTIALCWKGNQHHPMDITLSEHVFQLLLVLRVRLSRVVISAFPVAKAF